VDVLDSWDVRNVSQTYDLAVGVGAVTSCPQAERKISFVLGQTGLHKDFGWSDIVVTSQSAYSKLFSHGSRIYLHPMPLLEMEFGRKRLMKEDKSLIRIGGFMMSHLDYQATLWQLPDWNWQVPFCAMEFNSRCLNGASGNYLQMTDGYDIQVRRHLALGSPVYCFKDKEVIGDLVDVVFDQDDYMNQTHLETIQEVIEDKVSKEDYILAIEELIRRN
jgi:hypothetical protein